MTEPEVRVLTIEEIAAGGDGLARTDSGRVVFLPRTAPGDRVVAQLTDNRARWSRGRVLEWQTFGPDRVIPTCPYYDTCGGCSIQHLNPRAQSAALHRGVGDALRRIGGSEIAIDPLEPSEWRFAYRNRVTFTLRRHSGRVHAGFHRLQGPRLADVDECALAEPPIGTAWRALRKGWGKVARALPGGRGELRLTLRAAVDGRTALLVSGGYTPGDPAQVLRAVPSISSYWWKPARARRTHLAGDALFMDTWDGVTVPLRPEAFLQVNRHVAADLDEHLDARLGPIDGLRIADLYGGVGLRALGWGRRGAQVTLVEASRDAIETAEQLASENDVALDVRRARVEQALGDLGPQDVILVNPPRSGLAASVSTALLTAECDRLIYVSCDPATLARDMSRLGPAWQPTHARLFDAFPQTGHVETVMWLEREKT